MNAQDWIDRYVTEVGRMLPAQDRADVEKEIRSLLQDALEAETAGVAASDEQVFAVLHQFGPPREIAMRYGASQWLIGPLLYPTFITVLRVVVGIVLAVSLFGALLSISQSPATLSVVDLVGGILNGLMQAVAWVVVIFALMERLNLRELQRAGGSWDPRSLPAAGNVDRVSTAETIVTVIFTTAFIVILGALLDSQGRLAVHGSEWTSVAIFSPAFMRYVPWIMALLAADVVLAVATLIRGRWTPALRALALLVNLASIVVAALMLTGPSLAVWELLAPAFDIVVAIVLVVNVVEAVQQGWRLMKR